MAEIIRATWDDLRNVVQGANTNLTICTPYFSSEGVGQLFDSLNESVRLVFITRLSPSDWLRGISSPEELLALLQVLEESGSPPQLIVHQRLHAKAYIADRSVGLIGSANLTSSGFETNFEIMMRLSTEEAMIAHEIIFTEISSSGKELLLTELSNWITRFSGEIQRHRPIEDVEAGTLAEMQRVLDRILGYGRGQPTQPIFQPADLEDYVAWLESHRDLPGADVLIDRHHNTSGQNLTGHFRQSYYAVRRFLDEYPDYIEPLSHALSALNVDELFQPSAQILQIWISFLDQHATEHGEHYDFAILRGILPPSLGGTRLGGGGGSSTLKRMLPLVARFVEESGGQQ